SRPGACDPRGAGVGGDATGDRCAQPRRGAPRSRARLASRALGGPGPLLHRPQRRVDGPRRRAADLGRAVATARPLRGPTRSRTAVMGSAPMLPLKGRPLFIPGGSRGIGLAIALRAARDGANVAIAAKTTEPHPKLPGTLYTAAEEIEKAGGRALPCVVD